MESQANNAGDPATEQFHSSIRTQDLAVAHLQFSDKIVSRLRLEGVTMIQDLMGFVSSDRFHQFRYRSDIMTALAALSSTTRGNTTDWRGYWKLRAKRLEQLCAYLPELGSLNEVARSQPVCRQTLGNAGAMLERAGYRTLGSLCDGLTEGIRNVPGLGPKKVDQLMQELLALAGRIDAEGNARLATLIGDEVTSFAVQMVKSEAMPDSLRRLPAGVLHIGDKAKWLRQAGLQTVGQVADAIEDGKRTNIKGLGPTTVALIFARVSALASNMDDDGHTDWKAYCVKAGITLLPGGPPPATGADFLGSLPTLLQELAAALPDEVYRDILNSRLSKAPGEGKTLEEIASNAYPPITRERVRQKEKKLLRQLAGGLIHDVYGGLNVHFHPDYSTWWRRAAASFRENEQASFDEFVGTLAESWNVERDALIEPLPIIVAIVTGEPQMPEGFRSSLRVNPILFGDLSETFMSTPLRALRVGRHIHRLEQAGLRTAGDIVSLCRHSVETVSTTVALREAVAQVETLADCLRADGETDWSAYRMRLGLETIPTGVVLSAEDFVDQLVSIVGELLTKCRITLRSEEIYRLRTSRPSYCRLTLEDTARHLQTHGPSVKREETEFLQFLNDIIIEGEFCRATVWIDSSWLRFWQDAEHVFGNCGADIECFAVELSRIWRLDRSHVELALPTLWAVLSGYPNGRPSRAVRDDDSLEPEPATEPVRIRLRGFRRVH